MKNIIKFTMLASFGVLAGCNSGGSSGAKFVHQYALLETDTAKKALEDGTTLEAAEGSSVATKVNHAERSIALNNRLAVKITTNPDGGFDLEANGVKVSFAAGDIDGAYDYFKEITKDGKDESFSLWNAAGTRSELLDGSDKQKFHRIIGYYLNVDGADTRGLIVTGTETPEDVLKISEMKAKYSGTFRADTYGKVFDDPRANSVRVRVRGVVSLEADFAEKIIAGSISSLETKGPEDSTYSALQGSVSLDQTAIKDNSYSGKFTSDFEEGGYLNGDYDGKFYGNDAQETAGTLKGSGKFETVDLVGTGAFTATKDPQP
ncbi:MAG: transferrin-binding protein-like solute binding protein [Rhizobiaceae bacterium]